MFTQDRRELRRLFYQAWQAAQSGQPLAPLSAQIAGVVAMHPEYHGLLETEQALDRDYLPETGETNPFLHMAMHIALQEQIATNRPAGIGDIHRQLQARLGDPHAAEHQMMTCLMESLWQAQRQGNPPDEQAYLACLQRLVENRP